MRRVVVLGFVAAAILAAAGRAYFATTKSTPQTVSAAADFLPPVASRSTVIDVNSATLGVIFPGRTYQVYAQVDDQGNPPSGTQTVTADVSSFSGRGATATLTPGSYTAGATYNYRSATQTASLFVGPGEQPYTVTMTDVLGQSATQSFSSKIGTVCYPSSLTTSNGGFFNQTSKVENGDTVSFAFNVAIDPRSIISYWTGAGTGVTVTIADHGSSDTMTIDNQSTGQPTPLGTIAMKGDFARGTTRFGGVIQMPRNDTAVVTVNGLYSGTGTPVYWPTKTAMTWTPSAGITDTNGNPCSTDPITQPSAVYNF